MGRSGRSQGGIIGKVNNTSFGKCKVTAVTATGNFTTQPGTGVVLSAVIAGGGQGGIGGQGGGGGAGGVLVTCSSAVCGATAYPATIGGGGAPTTQPGHNPTAPSVQYPGTNTSIIFGPVTLTAIGGGGAGTGPPVSPVADGAPGGSGGGGGYNSSVPAVVGGCGTACQGNDGGDTSTSPKTNSGGGGGAGAVGTDGTSGQGGPGGAGRDLQPFFGCTPQPFYIANGPNAGASVGGIFAGGGGGALCTPACNGGCGGTGGGGNASQVPGACGGCSGSGVANTGGGGGGVHLADGGGTGTGGGSGIVIVKELNYASGMWPMQQQFRRQSCGSWPYTYFEVDYLVLAGGGGGGAGYGGGGGAGGYITSYGAPRCAITLCQATPYPITIGAGGIGGVSPAPSPTRKGGCGTNSVAVIGACTVTAAGGGGGGGESQEPGKAGGSGGGAAGADGCGGAGNTPPLSPVQGYAGGDAGPNTNYAGGGGGGASAVGTAGTPGGQAGPGGAGEPNAIAPAFPVSPATIWGGGGGGATYAGTGPGTGGPGGGGNAGATGSPPAGSPGTDGKGGGGGAGGFDPSCGHHTGGTGGTGVVILRFPTASKSPSYAVAPGTNTTTTCGSCTMATFTVTGTFTL
jgi:hypothetical protein